MAEREPREVRRNVFDLQKAFISTLDLVQNHSLRVLIEEGGRPVAVLIPIEDYEQIPRGDNGQMLITPTGTSEVRLSRRENDVLRLVSSGMRNPEIARELSVQPKTVEFHMTNLFDKLGADNRTHLIFRAVTEGLLNPPDPEVIDRSREDTGNGKGRLIHPSRYLGIKR